MPTVCQSLMGHDRGHFGDSGTVKFMKIVQLLAPQIPPKRGGNVNAFFILKKSEVRGF